MEQLWARLYDELGVSPPAPETRPLAECIAVAADRIGAQNALFFRHRHYSFDWLDRQASRLANRLAEGGLGKGDVLAIYLPNTPQFVVALVAASRLGAITTGISTLLTPPELDFQLRDSGARALVMLDAFAPRLTALDALPPALETVIVTGLADCETGAVPDLPGLAGVRVMSWSDALAGQPEHRDQTPVAPDDTMLLQYTGGTTGLPKGAMLSVQSVMSNPVFANVFVPYRYGDERMASPFPFFHIGGISGLIGAISAGAEFLVTPDPRDVEDFIAHVIEMRPTRLGAVPTFYTMLLTHPRLPELDFSDLRCAITGAAPITQGDRARLAQVLGEGKLMDVFGMTETCPVYVANPPRRAKPDALGIPTPGTGLRIVDTETGTRDLPPGEHGEIVTAGLHVMQGYWNLPGETARALREQGGRVWMHTGDVGFIDKDGYLHIADRAKDMLIVGGFKVFSLEVESKLKELDAIAASAVIGSPDADRPGNDVVNLFVQPAPGHGDDLRDRVLAFCRANMAPYKVPKRIEIVDHLPLTPVGKIDKKALRARLQGLGAGPVNRLEAARPA